MAAVLQKQGFKNDLFFIKKLHVAVKVSSMRSKRSNLHEEYQTHVLVYRKHKAARDRDDNPDSKYRLRVVKPRNYIPLIGDAQAEIEVCAMLLDADASLASRSGFIMQLLYPPRCADRIIKVRMSQKGLSTLQNNGYDVAGISYEIGFFFGLVIVGLNLNGSDVEFFLTSQGLKVIDLDLVSELDGSFEQKIAAVIKQKEGFSSRKDLWVAFKKGFLAGGGRGNEQVATLILDGAAKTWGF